MSTHQKYKVYGVVIVVGLIALGADRFFGADSAPRIALALSNGLATDGAEGEGAQPRIVGSAGILVLPFPRGLPPFEESIDGALDMFAPPEEANPTASAPLPPMNDDGAPMTPPDEFVKKHRLEGTLVGKRHAQAFVSGRTLTLGDQLDGFEVAIISPDGVLFRRGAEIAVLKRPEPLERTLSRSEAP